MDEYLSFLQRKQKTHIVSGFECDKLNKKLFVFQNFIVKRALRAGKYAIFADCGLGKTLMQLEWAQKIIEKEQKPIIILAPLAVTKQTILEGDKFGYQVEKYSENHTLENKIYITNGEKFKIYRKAKQC